MIHLLVNGVVVTREDRPVTDAALRALRERLKDLKSNRDRFAAQIADIKAQLADIKALDPALDTSDLP